MSAVKKATITSFCIALCYVLPQAFHAAGLGMAFSPMHLPVLMCGLLCGWPYGAVCGLAGPVLSFLLTGMPGAPQMIHMVPELVTYGLGAGLIFGHVRTGKLFPDLYLALLPAMALGRVVGGVCQALVYLSTAKKYSLALWAGSYLVGTAPGALLHLVVLPTLVVVLTRARLIPIRYPSAQPQEG